MHSTSIMALMTIYHNNTRWLKQEKWGGSTAVHMGAVKWVLV